MTDFIFMVRDRSYMFVTGPEVVKTVTNETVTAEELGGAKVHTTKSSVADGAYENDIELLLQMRRLMDFLPQNNTEGTPEWPSYDDPNRYDMSLDSLIPDNSNTPYDMKELILKIVDEGTSSRFRKHLPAISSPVSPAWRDAPLGLWPQPAYDTCERTRCRYLAQGGKVRPVL